MNETLPSQAAEAALLMADFAGRAARFCERLDERPLPRRTPEPRSFSCIPSSLLSWAGGVMASAFSSHAGRRGNAPAIAPIEETRIRRMRSPAGWTRKTRGFPKSFSRTDTPASSPRSSGRKIFCNLVLTIPPVAHIISFAFQRQQVGPARKSCRGRQMKICYAFLSSGREVFLLDAPERPRIPPR